MKCSIDGWPREYKAEKAMQTVRHRGQAMVIDHVPPDVCSVCRDTLLRPGTVRRIEALLQEKHQPAGTVPLYEFVIIWFVLISAKKATRMEKEDYEDG